LGGGKGDRLVGETVSDQGLRMGRVTRGNSVGAVLGVCSGLRTRKTVETLVHLGVKLCHVSDAYLFEFLRLTAFTETLFYLESRRVLRHHQPQ
jgi:hypothetical protein